MTYIYEMGQAEPVGYIEDFYSSGSCNRIVVNGACQKWTCHYCGSLVKPELDQCPKCAGERKVQYSSQSGNSRVRYVEDDPINVSMNIITPPRGVLERVRMAMRK